MLSKTSQSIVPSGVEKGFKHPITLRRSFYAHMSNDLSTTHTGSGTLDTACSEAIVSSRFDPEHVYFAGRARGTSSNGTNDAGSPSCKATPLPAPLSTHAAVKSKVGSFALFVPIAGAAAPIHRLLLDRASFLVAAEHCNVSPKRNGACLNRKEQLAWIPAKALGDHLSTHAVRGEYPCGCRVAQNTRSLAAPLTRTPACPSPEMVSRAKRPKRWVRRDNTYDCTRYLSGLTISQTLMLTGDALYQGTPCRVQSSNLNAGVVLPRKAARSAGGMTLPRLVVTDRIRTSRRPIRQATGFPASRWILQHATTPAFLFINSGGVV